MVPQLTRVLSFVVSNIVAFESFLALVVGGVLSCRENKGCCCYIILYLDWTVVVFCHSHSKKVAKFVEGKQHYSDEKMRSVSAAPTVDERPFVLSTVQPRK